MTREMQIGGLVRHIEVQLDHRGCEIPIDLRGADHTEVRIHIVVDLDAIVKALIQRIRVVGLDPFGHSLELKPERKEPTT
jgi:hypothetical protein